MDNPRHLLDLIRMVKPRAALFTTYTFSVSHFDTVFIPVLRSVGCHDISVLVDANEAARCSEEALSRAAGRVYRIAPVVAPGGGVFHPKLCYLAAEAGDVLAVGSGNLTASGQSLQLESFDAVAAAAVPSVFRDLADWMELLASLTKRTSPQASQLLVQTAPRARQAYRLNAGAVIAGPLPPPSLIHTLNGPARDALEANFILGADRAESLTVLSPFHAPDGGSLLRLAVSVDARSLAIGLDGGRKQLVAPFERGRFKPHLPSQFVIPDTPRNNKRLHAKVFELRAADRALVMTGSINATAQSFESTKNVEVSLARWLPASPYTWKVAEPAGYEATQCAFEFEHANALYVDAWLDSGRMLHGQLASRHPLPRMVRATVHNAAIIAFEAEVDVGVDGAFRAGPLPVFDTSQATQLTVLDSQTLATCWLNVHEELDIAAEERDRRAAISRVLRGEYAAEDLAEVVRLLSAATHGMAAAPAVALRRAFGVAEAEEEVPFSFMRWEHSGHQRGGNTLLGRNPYELLRALNRWMNADLTLPEEGCLQVPASKGLGAGVQLLGGTNAEQQSEAATLDPYTLLDQLCLAIPVALERQPELEYGGVLAEVAASRAVHRAFKQDLNMAPCLSWLDRFSRIAYPDGAREGLSEVAVAMACVTAARLERHSQDPQLSMLREAVERLCGGAVSDERWKELCAAGLSRDLYRRVAGADLEAAVAMTSRLASAPTLDDSMLCLLRKAVGATRHLLASEPEAAGLPEVAAALRGRRPKKTDLLRGLLDQKALTNDGLGCPFCYEVLSKEHVAILRQRHALVHKGLTCNRVLFYSEHPGRLAQGIQELPDA
ncbi:MAG: hypothetical protein JSS31_14740 [Proteobacteria bacterium]|nr:hypothetical protein [Pseudomonadota bacterium]MBS0495169.1 hypothetical protein [Pseudomonadota bacterium]